MSREQRIAQLLDEAWKTRGVADYERGKRLADEAAKLCGEDGHESLGRVAHVYGQFERDQGNTERALQLYREGYNHYVAANHTEKMAHSLRHVADVCRDLPDWQGAARDYRSAIQMYRDLDPTPMHSLENALRGFGMLLERVGKKEEAGRVFEEAHQLYRQVDNTLGIEEMGTKLKDLRGDGFS